MLCLIVALMEGKAFSCKCLNATKQPETQKCRPCRTGIGSEPLEGYPMEPRADNISSVIASG